jgi:hypothetical protein
MADFLEKLSLYHRFGRRTIFLGVRVRMGFSARRSYRLRAQAEVPSALRTDTPPSAANALDRLSPSGGECDVSKPSDSIG